MAKKAQEIQATNRIFNNIEKMQGKRYPAATPEDAAQRAAEMRTQGKKGAKANRYNMAFTPLNYEYINIVSRVKGMTMTKFVNEIIAEYRENNPEIYEKAKKLVEES